MVSQAWTLPAGSFASCRFRQGAVVELAVKPGNIAANPPLRGDAQKWLKQRNPPSLVISKRDHFGDGRLIG
jgi:hypothetical protein